jgi:hypothetical protein
VGGRGGAEGVRGAWALEEGDGVAGRGERISLLQLPQNEVSSGVGKEFGKVYSRVGRCGSVGVYGASVQKLLKASSSLVFKPFSKPVQPATLFFVLLVTE